MTIRTYGTYCTYWETPVLPSQLKCRHRVIAQETPAYKGKPICVNAHKSNMVCCKESEYSIRISAEISQELPGYTCEHCKVTYNNNYPCPCRSEQERNNNMGAPIPALQQMRNSAAYMSQALTAGNIAANEFRRAIQDRWNVDAIDADLLPYEEAQLDRLNEQYMPPNGAEFIESMNPKDCTKFDANEFGNCKNLHWCFRVFGIELQCQQTRKEVVSKTLKEHRRLEIPDGTM